MQDAFTSGEGKFNSDRIRFQRRRTVRFQWGYNFVHGKSIL
jgi:hypothetical protein